MRVPKGSGFDYLGEPTPFSFPNRNSNWGIHDLAGFKKARLLCFVLRTRVLPTILCLRRCSPKFCTGR
jgi:hypothetical protein